MQINTKMLTRDYSESASNPGVLLATVRFQGPGNELVVIPMSFAQAQKLNFNDTYVVDVDIPE